MVGSTDSASASPSDRASDSKSKRNLVLPLVVVVVVLGAIVVSVVAGSWNRDGDGSGATNGTAVSAQGNQGKGGPPSQHVDAEVRASQPLSPAVIAVVQEHTDALTTKVIARTWEFEKKLRADLEKGVQAVAEEADSWHFSLYRGKIASVVAPGSYKDWVDDLRNSKVFRIADIQQATKELFMAVEADFREYHETILKDIRREASDSSGLAKDWESELASVFVSDNLWTTRVRDIVAKSARLDLGSFALAEVATSSLARRLIPASAAPVPTFFATVVVGLVVWLVVEQLVSIVVEKDSASDVSEQLRVQIDNCLSAIINGGKLASDESNYRRIVADSRARGGSPATVMIDAQLAAAIRSLHEKRLLLADRIKTLEEDEHYSMTLRPAFQKAGELVLLRIEHCRADLLRLQGPNLADRSADAIEAATKREEACHLDFFKIDSMQGHGSNSKFREGVVLALAWIETGADAERAELASRLRALRRAPKFVELYDKLHEIQELSSECSLGVRPLLTDLVASTEEALIRSID